MNEEQRQELIGLLEQRVASLKVKIRDTKNLIDEEQADDDGDPWVVTMPLVDCQVELAGLVQNYKWLNSDEAGFCQKCGSEIPYERLKAVLDTQVCIQCAK